MQVELTVGDVLDAQQVSFHLVAGRRGRGRAVRARTVQRLGVALTGYTQHITPARIQLAGNSESGYLEGLSAEARGQLIGVIFRVGIPALVVTASRQPAPEALTQADQLDVPVITTDLDSEAATDQLNELLTARLSPRDEAHGVLVDVHGVGVLIIGKSGIGKSEVALELLASGHRLVADDRVLLQQQGSGIVVGLPPEISRHHMEIRGLGILNINHLFGAAAVRDRKRVELCVELISPANTDPPDPAEIDSDRTGLETHYTHLAGVPIPHLRVPVRPGRSLKLIIEVAARNRLLQAQGIYSARMFADRLQARILEGGPDVPQELVDGDLE